MSNTVHVKNISSGISEKEVRDFFSFCGKITSLSVTPTSSGSDAPQSATVTFEKETAAKTALLLDNTQLGNHQVQVTSASSIDDLASSAKSASTSDPSHTSGTNHDDIDQEDKPRSRIVAEYLAHGYVIGDSAIQRAIELDNKHGISNRFTNALSNFDAKYKATDKARSVDASYGVTNKATQGWRGLNSYFEKALETPTGQKMVGFYSTGQKQVQDIHAEAIRLAGLKKQEQGIPQTGKMGMHAVPGTNKTVCSCGGNTGSCPCEAGKCGCAGCDKAGHGSDEKNQATGMHSVAGQGDSGHTATGAAPEIAAQTNVVPLGSANPGEAVGQGAELAGSSGLAPGGGQTGMKF